MKPIRKLREITSTEQIETVQIEQPGVVSGAGPDDVTKDVSHPAQREGRIEDVRRVGRRSPTLPRLGVGDRRAGGVLVHGTDDRRDHQDGGCRRTVADRVEESVHSGDERPPLHRVSADDVDPDLEAEEVRTRVPHRAGSELIEMGVRGEPEVREVQA